MTRNIIAAALSLLITISPAYAGGGLLLPSFKTVRQLADGPDAAAPIVKGAPMFTPVKYKQKKGPGYEEPWSPKRPVHVTEAHTRALLMKMAEVDQYKRGRIAIPEAVLQRLISRMIEIDADFVDPVTSAAWDEIVKVMGETAEAEFDGAKGDWELIADKMLKAGVKKLRDPHSVYWNTKETKDFMDQMQGTFAGLGVQIKKDPKGVKIQVMFPGSGAKKAGLKTGDIVTEADGVALGGKEVGEAVEKLKGEAGTRVTVFVDRDGVRTGPFVVTRVQVQMPNAFSKMVGPKVGYVYFNQFQEDTDKTVFAHIRRLKAQGADRLILDVRANPGGTVSSVSSIVSEFLKDGDDIVAFKKQGKVQYKNVTDGNGMFMGMPVVVLVNGFSASASEILAGAFQDHFDSTVVIGSQSYGKGSAQGVSPGPSGRTLKITGSRWYTPDDRTIDAKHDPDTGEKIDGTGGVTPDIVVPLSEEQEGKVLAQIMYELNGMQYDEPRVADPVLEKAVEVLGALGAG